MRSYRGRRLRAARSPAPAPPPPPRLARDVARARLARVVVTRVAAGLGERRQEPVRKKGVVGADVRTTARSAGASSPACETGEQARDGVAGAAVVEEQVARQQRPEAGQEPPAGTAFGQTVAEKRNPHAGSVADSGRACSRHTSLTSRTQSEPTRPSTADSQSVSVRPLAERWARPAPVPAARGRPAVIQSPAAHPSHPNGGYIRKCSVGSPDRAEHADGDAPREPQATSPPGES